MKTGSTKFAPNNLFGALLLLSFVCFEAWSQTTPATDNAAVPLNLNDRSVIREMVKEEPAEPAAAPADKTQKLSGTADPLDASFVKAEKHGIVPTVVETNVPGAPQRVTKVTGADGSYCVYTPTVARTDGIDEIQNGLQTQVRTCPQ